MKYKKGFFTDIIPIVILLPVIAITGIIFGQSFIKLLPCIGSLFIALFVSKAYRIGFLFAALNAAIYAIGFTVDGLYGSLYSCLLISMPLSLISYFKWKKHAVGKTTVIKKATFRIITLSIVLCIGGWAAFYIGASQSDSTNKMIWLDSALVPFGLTVTLLQMFAYKESCYINVVSCMISVALWIILTLDNIANINYLLISLYNIYRVVFSAIRWTELYKIQNSGI